MIDFTKPHLYLLGSDKYYENYSFLNINEDEDLLGNSIQDNDEESYDKPYFTTNPTSQLEQVQNTMPIGTNTENLLLPNTAQLNANKNLGQQDNVENVQVK